MSSRVAARALASALLIFLSAVARPGAADEARAGQTSAPERKRFAVLIVADGDRSLSDNLTEVAISTLAGSGGWDFVGLKELRGMLTRLASVQRDGLDVCLERSDCRLEVVGAAGAARAITGRIHARSDGYSIELVLSDVAQAEPEHDLHRTAALEIKPLISAVQSAVRELAIPKASPEDGDVSKPIPLPTVTSSGSPSAPSKSRPIAVPPASLTPVPVEHETARHSTRTARYVAYGAAAVSIISFSAAAIAGSIAAGAPTGNTRADVQSDLHRRAGYQKAAIGLLASGGVFATVSLVSLTFP